MAKVIKRIIYYTIELSDEEALWLKAMVQNPLVPDEYTGDSLIRKSIFNALTEAGVELI